MTPPPYTQPLARWFVRLDHLVAGRWLHFFPTRAKQRSWAKVHAGQCCELVRSKH